MGSKIFERCLNLLNVRQPARKDDDVADAADDTNVLNTFVGEERSALDKLKADIDLHRKKQRDAQPKSRQSVGLEIGAGVAKFFVKQWMPKASTGWTGKTIVDAKMRLAKRNGSDQAYREQIDRIFETFGIADHGRDGDWLVPPKQFDFERPRTLLKDCRPDRDILYVYGTQGPREAARTLPLHPDEMRILTGDEEGLLVFEAIVPKSCHKPGAMAIEIGTGSTELALIGRENRKHAITFAIGGAQQTGLDDIVRGITSGNIVRDAGRYLESKERSAQSFIDAARVFTSGGTRKAGCLFINPNTDSAEMRSRAGNTGAAARTLDVGEILHYAQDNETAPFARKALILGRLAKAFAFATVHEGTKGGLKEGMAQFIGEALT
jgi:hypothetical protein